MSEWKETKLNDLTSRITKGTTPSTIGGAFLSNGINFIKSESVSYNGKIDKSTFAFISEETHNKLKRSQLEKNDILFSMAGIYLGKSGYVTEDLLPANTNQALAIIKVDSLKALPKFIHFVLQQKSVIEYVNTISGQSAQPNINMEEIGSIEFLLPPLPEQERIAEVLSSLDDKIDLLHRQNKTLEEMAETLFRQWFEKLNDRDSTTLGEYVKIQNGFAFKSNDFKEIGNNGVLKITNISFEKVDIQNTQYVDDDVVSNLSEKFKVSPKSFLIAMTGAEIGKIGIVGKTTKNLYINQRVGMLVDVSYNSSLLGYLFLKSAEGQDHITNTCTGSAQENISSLGIESMIVPQSTNDEVIEFCESVNPLFEKIISNLEQIQQLETLRDTLLPKLMSGAINIEK
jgi:type I restriction enzyme S subunit